MFRNTTNGCFKIQQMNEFINKVQYLIEKDGLSKPNRKRELIYRKCYLQHKLREAGMTYKDIGSMFNMNHASVIHSVKTHDNLAKYYNAVYSAEISEYIAELDGVKPELPKRDLIKDLEKANSLYALNRLKRWVKEKKYNHYGIIEE
jgi:hypothetical protein